MIILRQERIGLYSYDRGIEVTTSEDYWQKHHGAVCVTAIFDIPADSHLASDPDGTMIKALNAQETPSSTARLGL